MNITEAATGRVHIAMNTTLPWDGETTIRITLEKAESSFALQLRLPGWISGDGPLSTDLYHFADEVKPTWQVSVNGDLVKNSTVEKGYIILSRR